MDILAVIEEKGLPLTGNLLMFRNDPLGYLLKKSKTDQYVVPMRFGLRQKVYLINHPDLIHEILVNKHQYFKKSKTLQMAKPVLGEGLLTNEGEDHLRQRRLISTAFRKQNIAKYADTMVDMADKFISRWDVGEIKDISEEMMAITLAVITKTMFSLDFEEGFERIGHAVDIGMKYVSDRARSVIQIPADWPTRQNREFQEVKQELDQTIFQIIAERRKNPSHEHEGDLLSILLKAKDEEDGTGMTDEQVRDEVMTIFLAGHETTANTLSWTFYLLSKHPEVRQKMFTEIDEVLQGARPSMETYDQLTYTQNVLWETLRLYPTAWTIGRVVNEDVEIGGHTFEKGDLLFMSQYVMHRKEKYFPDPESYKPDRFENNFLNTIPKFAYFPFGGGPRVCIGNHFAMLEAVMVLSRISQKFQLELAQTTVEAEPLITLRPKGGLRMRINKRE